jgi:hypothetical protein
MSWTDKCALNTIKQLRNEFKIDTFVETGTFKGINAFVQSKNFKWVLTCEKIPEYYVKAKKLLEIKNTTVFLMDSPKFLKEFAIQSRKENYKKYVFFYLDAHFYDKNAMEKFIVKKELEVLEGYKKSIIAIHDFDNGMGHITYDGKTIDMEMVKERLLKINPKFVFYTNTPEFTDILTVERLKEIGLENNKEAIDNINYAWTNDRLKIRGILYAVPRKLDLKKYKLIEWN